MGDGGGVASAGAVGVIGAVVGTGLVVGLGWVANRFRSRGLRRFWRGYDGEFVIMITEYELGAGVQAADISNAKVASTATSGALVSYGMAMGLAQLVAYFERTRHHKLWVVGDKSKHRLLNKSLIVLGSPANNQHLETLIESYAARGYPKLKEFQWTATNAGVELTLPTGTRLQPTIDDNESGTDYALVVYLKLDDGAQLTMIAGCNMWATRVAAEYLTDRDWIKKLPRKVQKRRDSGAFVLRAEITQGEAARVQLEPIDGEQFFGLC